MDDFLSFDKSSSFNTHKILTPSHSFHDNNETEIGHSPVLDPVVQHPPWMLRDWGSRTGLKLVKDETIFAVTHYKHNSLKQLSPTVHGLIFGRDYYRKDICVRDLVGLLLEGLSIGTLQYSLSCTAPVIFPQVSSKLPSVVFSSVWIFLSPIICNSVPEVNKYLDLSSRIGSVHSFCAATQSLVTKLDHLWGASFDTKTSLSRLKGYWNSVTVAQCSLNLSAIFL